jgi:hypothetical protein
MTPLVRASIIGWAILGCSRTDGAATPSAHAGAPHDALPYAGGGAGAAPATNTQQATISEDSSGPVAQLPACTETTGHSLDLRGLTQDLVRARFGSPSQEESFRVEERQGEFYGPIANTYPTTDPQNRNVPLEQWTWRSGDCFLTVWFHRREGVWSVLDDFYWHKDAAF